MEYQELQDGKHYANPVWSTVDVSRTSGNLVLSVLWRALGTDGQPLAGYESAKSIHVLAYADEKRIADTIKARDRVMEWCPEWDGDPLWFADNAETMKAVTALITVEHEVYQDRRQCRAKWVDPVRKSGGTDSKETISREELMAKFGKILKATGVKVRRPSGAKKAETKATSTRDACWDAFIAQNPGEADGVAFWKLVGDVTHGESPDLVTPEQWGEVLTRIQMPF